MNNILIWVGICTTSIILGFCEYKALDHSDTSKSNCFKFMEFWRFWMNYLVSFIIIYYFVSVRWIDIGQGGNFTMGDFVLGVVFLVGIFGWLAYFIKNVTEGINVIIKRVLDK